MTQTRIESPASNQASPPRLTQMSSCAGCAAKLSQTLLGQVLAQLPALDPAAKDANVLVGADTFDDAGVYQIRPDLALVQTVDFFTPIVDDPFDYGQIAAANALSDVFAMGGRPLTAMNLLGVPADHVPPHTIAAILRGGAARAKECNCMIVGGHTIRLPEPVYGMSVTGLVHPDRVLKNSRARTGDLLVLTKPLGTGIATTGIKREIAAADLAERAVCSMKQLNTAGAELAERGLVICATDVTGFGLLGHLHNILRASGMGAEIVASDAPALSPEIFSLIDRACVPGGTQSNRASADLFTDWTTTPAAHRTLLVDAQTSGGLLLCVNRNNLSAVNGVLRAHQTLAAAVIGRIVESRQSQIVVRP